MNGGLYLGMELHQEGSASAACAAGLFFKCLLFSGNNTVTASVDSLRPQVLVDIVQTKNWVWSFEGWYKL